MSDAKWWTVVDDYFEYVSMSNNVTQLDRVSMYYDTVFL